MIHTEKNVLEDFKPFINENGMVPYGTPPPTVSQNDTLFTAYYMMALENALGSVPEHERLRLIDAYDKHIQADGLTVRTPVSTELESHDNLTGWGVAAVILKKPEYAQKILSFARYHGWIWPETGTDEGRRYLGRHRVVEPHLQLAAGEIPDFLMQAVWCFVVLTSLNGKGDSYSLPHCLVYVAEKCEQTPKWMKLVGAFWKMWQTQVRFLSFGENLAKFYGWGGSPHVRYL